MLLAVFFSSTFVHANTDPTRETLDLSHVWFKPYLVEDKDPICKTLLTSEINRFFAKKDATPFPYEEIPFEYRETKPLTLNNQVIFVERSYGIGCGGACDREGFRASKKPIQSEEHYSDDDLSPSNESHSTESAPAYGDLQQIVKDQNGNIYAIIYGERTLLYKLTVNASWAETCKISFEPVITSNTSVSSIYNSINQLNTKVDAILGQEGNFCGSMHTLSKWSQFIEQNLKITVTQPWALKQSEHDDLSYDQDIAKLKIWSLQDPYNKKALDGYLQQLQKTTSELSNFS